MMETDNSSQHRLRMLTVDMYTYLEIHVLQGFSTPAQSSPHDGISIHRT